jgi:hypothetical protein
MSNERTDEFLSWRGRLDQPDALPEQGLDNHEASWQRLAERLREKPRRRMTGYWAAAACLLLALIPTIRFLHPRSPATALRPPAPVTRHTSIRRQALVEKVAAKPLPMAYAVTPPSVVNHPRSPAARPTPRPAGTPASSRTELPLLSSAVSTASPSNVLSTAVPTAAPSRVLSPQKQLKVVYYNELSNPSGPSPSMAARTPGLLKLSLERFGSRTTAGDQEAQSNNDPVLTIKLIPKNN